MWNPSLSDHTCRLRVHVQSSTTQPTCLYPRPSHSTRPCLCSRSRSLNAPSRLILSSRSPMTCPICLDAIPSLRVSSAITTRSVMPSRMGLRVAHLIGTSPTSIHLGSIKALAFPCPCHVIYGCRIAGVCSNLQHAGWGAIPAHACCPVLALKKPISKEVARDTRLGTLAHTMTHVYATG